MHFKELGLVLRSGLRFSRVVDEENKEHVSKRLLAVH